MTRCEKGFTDDYEDHAQAPGWLTDCPNMKFAREGEDGMKHYACEVCGERRGYPSPSLESVLPKSS